MVRSTSRRSTRPQPNCSATTRGERWRDAGGRHTRPGLEGLSGWLSEDARVMTLLAAAHRNGAEVVTSAMTILEASFPGVARRRLDWLLSRLRTEPVTERSARAASSLLAEAGLHGHSHAIDAVIAELASRQTRPVAVLTSDPGDLELLCEAHVRLVRV